MGRTIRRQLLLSRLTHAGLMNAKNLLFICLGLIAASIMVAPASLRIGIQWGTATDISYLFLISGIVMAMMTIKAEKEDDINSKCRKKL
jgi:hypothetical protein